MNLKKDYTSVIRLKELCRSSFPHPCCSIGAQMSDVIATEMMGLIGAGNNPQATYDCCCCSCVSKKQVTNLNFKDMGLKYPYPYFLQKSRTHHWEIPIVMCPLFFIKVRFLSIEELLKH